MLNLIKIISTTIEAGKKTLNIYDQKDYNISLKGDFSPLTLADKLSNDIIINDLKKTGIPILSEEGNTINFEERSQWDKFWLVDPLDGTKEFINKNGEFTINIALIEAGKPIAGFVYVPVKDILYVGILQGGIFEGHSESVALKSIEASKKINLKPIPDKHEDSIIVMGSRSHMNEETQRYIDNLKLRYPELTFKSRGSSLKICALAEGSAHYYPRYAPTMEWDTGAAHAVLLAAGGRIMQKENGLEVAYNKKDLLNPHFLALGPGMK